MGQPQEVTLVPIIPHWAHIHLSGLPSSLRGPHFHQIHQITSLGPPVISLGSLTCESYEVLRGSVEVIENPLREPNEVSVELSEVI